MKCFNLIVILIIIISFICSSCNPNDAEIELSKGVSKALADYRKNAYSEVAYDLKLDIPATQNTAINGEITISFIVHEVPDQHLILDFNIDSITAQKIKFLQPGIEFAYSHEHIVIDRKYLAKGQNQFTIAFTAGDQSLNRNEDYLYTLFVPDRASTAFPCFDQPDLKARFTLTLEVPAEWKAVSNNSLVNSKLLSERKTLVFKETAPLPTYLFAFAAGQFKVATSDSDTGRAMNMYYRETDSIKVAENQDEIFRLHQQSLSWLEDYTGISYPFEKFDFVLIPPFQYGGMEHPGSIFYRERSLFLDKAATTNDKLSRASLIAHETAHIWFGDLVTMKWFNDVWSKEVFANFMADKIVNPSFPEIDHKLKFLLRMHPAAYRVDRTRGANAIRQHLGNLKNAGLMYGPIIYQKAPVMMKQLENLVGKEAFRQGMQEYLNTYAFSNADWNDLIRILDQKTDTDLVAWSKIWIEEPGMPVYSVSTESGKTLICQQDPMESDRIWMQNLQVTTNKENSDIYLDKIETPLELQEPYEWLILNGAGTEYGSFILDEKSTRFLLENTADFPSAYLRGKILLNLYETFLVGKIQPDIYFRTMLDYVIDEPEPLLLDQLLGQLQVVYWNFLSMNERKEWVGEFEKVLLDRIGSEPVQNLKVSLYRTYSNIFQSQEAQELLLQVWQDQAGFSGIPLSSRDYTSLAMKLALRSEDSAFFNRIMSQQLERLTNPDDRKRLYFIKPSLNPDQEVRDLFFQSLNDPANRDNEPWVLTAMSFLHHPLRQPNSIKYIQPSLEMLGEIQRTGDIFFPGQWVEASLESYQAPEVLEIVENFMATDDAKALNPKLQLKVWVAADLLERSIKERSRN